MLKEASIIDSNIGFRESIAYFVPSNITLQNLGTFNVSIKILSKKEEEADDWNIIKWTQKLETCHIY
jgi:hypothetical protein